MNRVSRKGFTFFILFAIIFIAGVILYYPVQNPSTSQSTTKTAVTEEYCSKANSCPTDKCTLVADCAGGSDGGGCALGEVTCEYKDLILKADYTEVSYAQAKQCAQSFITQNLSVYPTLKYFEIGVDNSSRESSTCNNDTFDKKDKFCWFMAMQPTDKNLPFAPSFYVGAQTCTVYWNLPTVFKTDLLPLTSVNYSPNQAIVCAEKYISANKTKYLEYKNFELESLHVPNEAPGSHAAITNSTKDVLFYSVSGKSSPQNIYLVVGAHSCTVYGVNEQYYTKP